MATTAILRSRDCLLRHPNPNFTKPRRRSSSIRRCEPNGRGHPNQNHVSTISSPATTDNKTLVMGQVRILKRGEALPTSLNGRASSEKNNGSNKKSTALPCVSDAEDLILCSTGRLGPDPETVQKEIKVSDLYAGAAPFVASPPPSSLPLPAFFTNKDKAKDATTDLRRLLKLDLV